MSSTEASPDSSSPGTGEYTHRQILTILSGLLMGMFLAALDQTIVSTAIRTISDDLHGLDLQAWATTAYLITSTIATPIYGKLGDMWGRKKLFMFAITVFIIGSAACSFSTSMYMLAAFRAFQGIGAGGLMTLVLAIIGDIVSPRERAKYTGYFMATFATSSVLGPVIGGFFAGAPSILGLTGWRWVFMVNVPIGIAALVVVFRTLHVHHVRRPSKIDWMGAVALVSFSSGIMFLMMGAWPVCGFFGLDALLVYFAFRANYRSGTAFEEISVTPSELHVRRVGHRGNVSEWTLNPQWVRLEREVHEEFGIERLMLVSHGRKLPVAAFLGPDEKATFATALSAAIGEARRGVTRTSLE